MQAPRAGILGACAIVSGMANAWTDDQDDAVDGLFKEFVRWVEEQGREVDLFTIEVALEWRVGSGGELARWSGGDVRHLLVDVFPREITIAPEAWGGVLDALRALVEFPGVDAVGGVRAVHAAIDRVEPEFRAAMADERNFGTAKFWAARMLEHGVDPEDSGQVQRFLDAVNAGEVEYDKDVLAEIMRRVHTVEMPSLPPVLVADEAELAALAERTVLVERLRTLVAWLGTGRALTATNRLRVADARELAGLLGVPVDARVRSSADLPEVSLLVEWAKGVRLVRTVKGRLVPVKRAAGLAGSPLELWRLAFDAFPGLGVAVCGPAGRYESASLVGQVLPELVEQLWFSLYLAGGTPIPVELMVDVTRGVLSELFDFGGGVETWHELMWRADLDHVIDALVSLGALERSTTDDPVELAKIAELAGSVEPDAGLVLLTPLGLWAIRGFLRERGVDAPTVPELADKPLAEVVAALAEASPELTDAALAAWVGRRTPADAAAELLGFAGGGPTAVARMTAWAGLAHTGPAGLGRAREVRAEGGVAGAMAAAWLVQHGELATDDTGEQEQRLILVENLAAMNDHGLLVEELGGRPVDEQLSLVSAVADAQHPDREAVLAAIGEEHPDPVVGEAARRASQRSPVSGMA